jgi:hypothetical protein
MRMYAHRSRASFVLTALVPVLVPVSATAQTDIAGSVCGAFSGTRGKGTQQSPASQAGGLIELRHIASPVLGFEATYSFHRANQTCTTDLGALPCPSRLRSRGCPECAAASTVTTTSTSPTQTSTKAVYGYGAGPDWGLLPHIGLRLQYRGNLYSAPNVTKAFLSTSAFTHTAEPMAGVCFRF